MPEHSDVSKPDTLPYLPPGQGAVQLAVGSADVAPYRPALQFVHTVAPVREYLPAGQLTAVALTDAEGHTYPALQLPEHPVVARPAVDPYRPAAQSTHTLAPVREYLPAGQIAEVALVDPAAHMYPALQFASHCTKN